jgi:hypothetical protein
MPSELLIAACGGILVGYFACLFLNIKNQISTTPAQDLDPTMAIKSMVINFSLSHQGEDKHWTLEHTKEITATNVQQSLFQAWLDRENLVVQPASIYKDKRVTK